MQTKCGDHVAYELSEIRNRNDMNMSSESMLGQRGHYVDGKRVDLRNVQMEQLCNAKQRID